MPDEQMRRRVVGTSARATRFLSRGNPQIFDARYCMTKTLTALAAAATLAVAAVAVPHQAEARWGGWHGGHGFHGAPILGGLAAGAIIGGALAAPYYYGDGPYYAYEIGRASCRERV